MNYQWHYDQLIKTRRERCKDPDTYYENHHIIMKSMGGSNEEDNLVYLTPREHFLAHWLLWRIHRNRETAYAFFTFIKFFKGHNHKNRTSVVSSRGYAEAKEAFIKMHSEKMKGVLNSNRSKIVVQMDMDENFIREWPSAAEAARILEISHITSCCRGERNFAGGFKWKYKTGFYKKNKPYKKRITNNIPNRKSVVQYNEDGMIISNYNSITAAVNSTGIPKSSIQANIAGILSHAGGFIWKVNNK